MREGGRGGEGKGGAWRAKKIALAVEGSHKKRGDLEEEGEGIKGGGGRAKISVSQGRPSAKSQEETPYTRYTLAYLETNLGIPNLFLYSCICVCRKGMFYLSHTHILSGRPEKKQT